MKTITESKRTNNLLFIAIILALVLIASFRFDIITSASMIDTIEQDTQTHFSTIDTQDLNCYGMSELAKEYFEDKYNFPVVFVHGEITRELKSLKHTWLMVKIEGNWHEFESTRLEFMDVSNTFELEYMTYEKADV